MSSAHAAPAAPGEIRGSVTPRLWTPPLVDELTPETSYGFDLIDFARDVIMIPFDPWQEWLAIHTGELLPDGRPRFRQVLVLVARQQGKSLYAKVLTLYWMFVEQVPLLLGTSTNRDYAKESWLEVCEMAQSNPYLSRELGKKCIRATIGEESLTTLHGSRYKIAASNRRAGRSLTVHRLILDELREHADWSAWNAAYNAMNAVRDAQVIAISNQGDDESVVLDSLRTSGLEFIETGQGDRRLGLFEWSCPAGSDPTDLAALAQACPDLGNRTDPDALLGPARRALANGGIELAGFRTEVMCMRVRLLDPAIDPEVWASAGVDAEFALDLATVRDHVALCLDLSLDGSHASLVAAALVDGIVHVDVVHSWDGHGCSAELRAELPEIVARVRPRVLGWFPLGPAAELTADLTARPSRGQFRWPPRGVELQALTKDTAAVCMAMPPLVASQLQHACDPMLTAHVESAQRLCRSNNTWVFQRKGTGPIDGVYAMAGAVHLARTLPPKRRPLVVL